MEFIPDSSTDETYPVDNEPFQVVRQPHIGVVNSCLDMAAWDWFQLYGPDKEAFLDHAARVWDACGTEGGGE